MTRQEPPRVIGVRHVGLSARDPTALGEFYRDVLGLQLVPTDAAVLGPTAFLGSHPAEAPFDLSIFANPALAHTAFEVRSLEDLRALHQWVIGRGVPIKMTLNHAVSLSFYFDDPEGHQIEVYWNTGVPSRASHGEPIGLTRSEEALLQDVAELAARVGAPSAASEAESGGR
ncbi:MAG: VOC family protein [Myxococcaceae bacterium]|nr:VOC family protein [Myxococcaceae bacterium]